jgi:UDP-glucose 4-epimerase
MKVVVTGATGNVGTSVVDALGQRAEVEQIVGLARRRPSWQPAKTRWEGADILTSDLASLFAGADAVIHLAWAIQPSHDIETLQRINLEVAAYELLRRTAEAAGDEETARSSSRRCSFSRRRRGSPRSAARRRS